MSPRRPRVLYLVYWGAAEPLGQALIVPAVRWLSSRGAEITLISFEKPADLLQPEQVAAIRSDLESAGVHWIPLRYHKRPKWPGTLWDLVQGAAAAANAARAGRFDVLHARTFVGGVMGACLAPLLSARLVFHNEGFYPDEQVDGGLWRRDSSAYRLAHRLEGWLYDHADALIVLSGRAREQVMARPAVRAAGKPVIVVPSCVDLGRFSPRQQRTAIPANQRPLRLVYVGSLGGRYRLDQIAAIAIAARELTGRGIKLRLLTPAQPAQVVDTLKTAGLREGEFSVERVPSTQVPSELQGHDAGLFCLGRGSSEHGCSPTKFGEYWATGLPVVTTPNIGDVDHIVRTERVGVIVRDFTAQSLERAVGELLALLEDPQLAGRCRAAAAAHFSLATSCERQFQLYDVACRH